MQQWQFLLYGITGNLAKIKILPALAQFVELNKEQVKINLIGYSRSKADLDEINKILNDRTPGGAHNLNSVQLIQGEYDDINFYHQTIAALGPDDRLMVYLALPPSTFLGFLQNSCPYSRYPIDIIMEKPFGGSPEEAIELLSIVDACKLHQRVHFFDHYLFKNAAILQFDDINNIQKLLKGQNIQSLTIKMLEAVGAGTRAGFYDQTGAIKDMWVHFVSLLQNSLKLIEQSPIHFLNRTHWNSLQLGQYQSYRKETEILNSTTETFFDLSGIFDSNAKVRFVSGKSLEVKETSINITLETVTLDWNLTDSRLRILDNLNQKTLLVVNFSGQNQDHTNLFVDLLNSNFEHFVDSTSIIDIWKEWQKVENLRQNSQQELNFYDQAYSVI